MEANSVNSKLWYFENFNFLRSMTSSEKMDLSACTVMKEVEKDGMVYLPHDVSSRVYFLKSGKVKIVSYSDEGHEYIHALLEQGEVFGELALAGEKTREQYAIVTEDALVCEISVQEFEKFLMRNPALNLEVTKLIGFRLKRIRTRLEKMWFKPAADRVKYILTELGQDHGQKGEQGLVIPLKLTHQNLASLAATTRQTVTTILNNLEKENIISYDRKSITLKKPELLN